MIKKIYFVTGSQHLYGEEVLRQVKINSKEIVNYLNNTITVPVELAFKDVVTTPEEITKTFKELSFDDECIGVINWMHTFSPSKMWINGLKDFNKPLLQFNTQFNKDIPWNEIDMNFMNQNQSAHGDREHGYIYTRMRKTRKVIAGYWKEEKIIKRISDWIRSAIGVFESANLNVVRFADNMRYVAVTEGDKVDAEFRLGWSVNGYGIGDLVKYVNNVSDEEIKKQFDTYNEKYIINTNDLDSVKYQAKIEVAIKKFLDEYNSKAFTTTFEVLHGLKQLPGLACQNLMADGYGFGAEGDWKTSALTRIMKAMSCGLEKGTSFIEDYTYHYGDDEPYVLGSHMLEVCPTISNEKAKIEVHPLSIGGKENPARLVFEGKEGEGILATLVDLGDRFRLIVAEISTVVPLKKMPKLPVASVMWKLIPNFEIGTESWMLAGGGHHSVISFDLTAQIMKDYAQMLGIEFIHINKNTTIEELEKEMLNNDFIYRIKVR